MIDSERSVGSEVLGTADKDDSSKSAGVTSPSLVWDRSKSEGEADPEVRLDGAEEVEPVRLSEEEIRDQKGAVAGAAASEVAPEAPAGSRDVNQSLARLEMNSLEVKLFLDSIDQRISRMEPRLEEIREGTPPVAEPAKVEVEAVGVEPERRAIRSEVPAAGSTTERRRRAQGVPVERRRAPHAVPADAAEVHRWSFEDALAFGRRQWVPVAVVGLLTTVLLMVFFAMGSHPRAVKDGAGVTATDAGPVLASAEHGQPKASADVPWGTRAATERGGSTGSGSPHVGDRLQTGQPVVEQGVVVPQVVPQQGIAPGRAVAPVISTGTSTASVGTAASTPTGAAAAGDAPAASGSGAGTLSGGAAQSAQEGAGSEMLPAPSRGGASGRIVAPNASNGSNGASNRRVNVSSGVMAGNLLYSPQPAYPKGIVSLFHPQGEVVMQAIISKRGRVQNLRVISGHLMLRGAAKDVVRTWRYRPYTINGAAVEVATIVSVDFHR